MSAPLAETNAPVAEGDVLAGKYRVERVLGQGAMGIVVAATHMQLQQRVAIKFLTGRATREVVGRFLREARSAVKLRNEHVARVIDVGELEGGLPYMVMEYLSGQDLQQVLKAEGPMPISEAVGFVLQVCEAMAEAHSAGIIHRDLKPSNLFLTTSSDGSKMVKVLDFGISKESNEPEGEGMSLTRTEAVLGSPLYMSIEQMRSSRDVDARADIYAMGAILFQLLTGRVPFEAQTFPELILKVASEEAPPPSTFRPDLPPPLELAILRCLEKDRTKRFPNVGELAAAIAPFATDEGIGSAERALRTIDKSAGGGGTTTLSPGALRATRNSMAGGTRTSGSWSTSTTTGTRGVSMKTVGLAIAALVLGAATVMIVVVVMSRPSTTNAAPATSGAPSAAPTDATPAAPSQTSAAPALTPVVVPAPYNDPGPQAKPSSKPTATASAGPATAAPPATTPATTQAPPPATAAPQPTPTPTPAPTPPPASTPTVTKTKNPLDIEIK